MGSAPKTRFGALRSRIVDKTTDDFKKLAEARFEEHEANSSSWMSLRHQETPELQIDSFASHDMNELLDDDTRAEAARRSALTEATPLTPSDHAARLRGWASTLRASANLPSGRD